MGLLLGFVRLGRDVVDSVTDNMEYSPAEGADEDPFATMNGCNDVLLKE